MNVNEKLESTLETIGLPVAYGIYEGAEPEYIVWNYSSREPVEYCNDEPESEVSNIQVHLYCKENRDYTEDLSKIKKTLLQEGFDYPGTSLEIYETDTGLWHICLETAIAYDIEK